jgi:hypothetical protein
MIPDIDIHRSAWLMIRRYGADASTQAATRADQLLEGGDLDGMLVWWAIIRAVDRLQASAAVADEGVH